MNYSLTELINYPTCLSEEIGIWGHIKSDKGARLKEMENFLAEYPGLRRFIDVIAARIGNTATLTLWLRILLAMQKDRQNGVSHTLETLGRIPSDFNPRDIRTASSAHPKPITFYLAEMDRLMLKAASG
ncbi:MAG TPA: hypothetical protein VHD69_01005 [Candidatus Paceibacterota bacterium]|nr:hypothetical protein [Candidatus Paceibacterota bacterium]